MADDHHIDAKLIIFSHFICENFKTIRLLNWWLIMMQVFKSQEIWHWEDKANVGWYVAVEEGIWRRHYHGGTQWFFYKIPPFYFGCEFVSWYSLCFWLSSFGFICQRTSSSRKLMKSWTTIHKDTMGLIRTDGLFTSRDSVKLTPTSLCKSPQWTGTWSTTCENSSEPSLSSSRLAP